MQFLSPIAALLGIELEELLEKLKSGAIAYGVAAAFGLIALAFLLVALNAWLTTLWGPIVAPLAIAVGALLLALVAYGLKAMADAAAHRRALERQRTAEKTALVTTAAVTALPLLMRSDLMKRVGIPLGSALAAAYLLSKPTGPHADDAPDDDA